MRDDDEDRDLYQAIGQRVRVLREARGERQEDLAARAGITPPMLSRLESGRRRPMVATLARVAAALDVTVAALIEGDDPELAREEAAMLECWRRLSPAKRRALVQLLEEFES